MRQYYEAYDDRYRQVHDKGLSWASQTETPVVLQVITRFGIEKGDNILEIGCGEGRDSGFLLDKGYDVLATDISSEAVAWCKKEYPHFKSHFMQLDCLKEALEGKFSFLYAVAVLHMLVEDGDRERFYAFFRNHLKADGIGLICTMGDGEMEFSSDISTAFDLQTRTHQGTGQQMEIAGTSCRVVSWETFEREIRENDLKILEMGLTEAPPDFSQMLYAVVRPQ